MIRDLHSDVHGIQSLEPQLLQTGAGTTNGATIDLADYDSVEFMVNIGDAGDVWSAANRFDFIMEHAADDGAGSPDTWEAVTDAADVLGATPSGTGVVLSFQNAADDQAVFRVGYAGARRFVRLNTVLVATHTNGTIIGVTAVNGHPDIGAVADTVPQAAP